MLISRKVACSSELYLFVKFVIKHTDERFIRRLPFCQSLLKMSFTLIYSFELPHNYSARINQFDLKTYQSFSVNITFSITFVQ